MKEVYAITFDGGWDSTGWALSVRPPPRAAKPPVPLQHGRFHVNDARRYESIWSILETTMKPIIRQLRADGHQVIIGIEKPPMTAYRGNQTQICYGMGQIGGALGLWTQSLRTDGLILPEPAFVPLADWRKYWSVVGKDKAALKLAAINVCTMLWGKALLEPYLYRAKDGGPRGDVADAMLQGAYLASNADRF